MKKLLCYTHDRTLVCVETGKKIRLTPKPFKVLCYLIEKKGTCVSKDELFSVCWKNSIVSEQSLTNTIGFIRKSIKELNVNDIRITTLSKSGYILESKSIMIIDGSSSDYDENDENDENDNNIQLHTIKHQSSNKTKQLESDDIQSNHVILSRKLIRIKSLSFLSLFSLTVILILYLIPNTPSFINDENYQIIENENFQLFFHDSTKTVEKANIKKYLTENDFKKCQVKKAYIRVYSAPYSQESLSLSIFIFTKSASIYNAYFHQVERSEITNSIGKLFKNKTICQYN
ncbi:hypothetical protein EA004_05480 [Vibrio anguillarum]|uniref:OmpR/PhoB-type domain-containing protein n=2 Tax=Vibrio anguillarum TaxID=55601 RepID=A0ABR9Z709_VIBAN|nr:winged helix-turn-helix domain-containing protein [Vibrio anguillarum]MBF4244499.1 hypothetical protein [Vibrio anguillarum]MBF4374250.1 hypothetical protein [Vibrio anguillarum]